MPNLFDGVQVVTLAVNLPGPLAAARLASMGAAVTKVEPPAGDPLAAAAPAWYAELTADQTICTLDLKDGSDRAALDTMLTDSDLLITAMRPSALRRLGLANPHERHPGLSHIEIVGYADDQEDRAGHDLTYQAAHGTLQPPTMPTVPIADLLGAERAVSAALTALLAAARGHGGQTRRVALDEAAAAAGAATRHALMGPGTPLGGATPTYGIYASADGFLALGALEPHFRDRVLELLQVEDRHEDLVRVFRTRTTADWEAIAAAADIPLVAIPTPASRIHRGDPHA